MFYLVKTPLWLKKIYPSCLWNLPRGDKKIYLTFDDGPHPVATPFVLDTLQAYQAKATFFCIGKNVELYPEMYKRILLEGHRVGNHTHNHLNGWKAEDAGYLDNVLMAARCIDSDLFRPPYGRITRFQIDCLTKPQPGFRIIMWDVLSGDFDTSLTAARCSRNVIKNAQPGSVVVFHDSEKAFERLKGALPGVLDHFAALGFEFQGIR